MSLSDQTQSGESSRETSEVFDSAFGFLMDFADRAETTGPQPKHSAVVDDDTTNEVHDDDDDEEEPSEDESGGNAGELLDKLPVGDKEALLKDVLSEMVGNMLDKLPEDGKEAFLVRCFRGLFTKLPRESQEVIRIKVEDASYESPSPSPSPSPIPTTISIPQGRIRLSSFARVQMDDFDPRFQSPSPLLNRFSVNHPDTVGNPRPPHPGPPPQQPLPGPQQPPPPPGPQQPTPGLTARRR